jgi:flagellar biosynthetic protein FliR
VQILIDSLGMRFDYNREMLIFGLILARTLPLVFLAPFLGGGLTPSEVKMGLASAIAILVWPVARDAMPVAVPTGAMPFLLLMMKETLIGLCIGFSASHIFTAMEVAGRITDTARGAAMGEVMVPSTKLRATVLGTMYQQLLVIFFISLGGYRIFFEAYFNSFVQLPLTGQVLLTPGYNELVAYMCRASANILYVGTILAAPAVAATFITDLVFGILNRVAPQLNAYFLAMPVKAMGALAMILLGLPAIIDQLGIYMQDALSAFESSIILLMPG